MQMQDLSFQFAQTPKNEHFGNWRASYRSFLKQVGLVGAILSRKGFFIFIESG